MKTSDIKQIIAKDPNAIFVIKQRFGRGTSYGSITEVIEREVPVYNNYRQTGTRIEFIFRDAKARKLVHDLRDMVVAIESKPLQRRMPPSREDVALVRPWVGSTGGCRGDLRGGYWLGDEGATNRLLDRCCLDLGLRRCLCA